MGRVDMNRRKFLEASLGSAAVGVGASTTTTGASFLGEESDEKLHTRITFRALVDAVVPKTPELEDDLGEEFVPGGLAIGLAEFMIPYVNNMFSYDIPFFSDDGNLQLATPFAKILDSAATKLLLKGDNESSLDFGRPLELFEDEEVSSWKLYLKSGPFAKLAPRDRLRAISLLDELELELSLPGDTFFEFDAGMVGQLVIGFTEAVYYSEWQGYEDFWAPPSEQDHPNDPSTVQGWRQTKFPGFADGHAAMRGYLSKAGSDLGAGETWKEIDDGVAITLESGEFRENDYDTSDYEEPFPVEDPPTGDDEGDESGSDDSEAGNSDGEEDEDDGWWF